MYRPHFNLERKPFQITSDNSFLWMGEKYAAALDLLKTGMAQNQGLLVLTGDIGTGKTTLINEILHTLEADTRFVRIVDPCFEMEHVFEFMAQTLGFDGPYKKEKNFSSAFFSFLKATGDNDKKILVIVDEAQRIPEWFLKEVLSWSRLGLNRVLTVILVGQLEFEDVLKTHLGPAWQDNINTHAFLEPLNEEETHDYIRKRLELAGTNRKIFLVTAIHEAHLYTKGIPRLINISCDQALIAAFAKNMRIVDAPTVRQVICQLSIQAEPSEHKGPKDEEQPKESKNIHYRMGSFDKKIVWLFAAACFCICAGYLFYTGHTSSALKNEASPLPESLKPEIGLGYTPAPTPEKAEYLHPILKIK